MTDAQDPTGVRASHEEREQIFDRLSAEAAAGRLTLQELEERIERAQAARTRGELEVLTRDLPDAPARTPARWVPTRWVVSVMGGSDRTGRWRASGRVNAIAVMGGHSLDLRALEMVGGCPRRPSACPSRR